MKPLATAYLCIAALCAGALAGCGVIRNPLPAKYANEATVEGMKDIRAWGSEYSPLFQADLVESIREARAHNPRGVMGPDGCVNVLAISGGGADGAFGAGLLCGWTETGTRPPFKLVTGISTGALIAPFAFVGPEYDDVLRKFYTSVSTPDIYTPRPLLALLAGADSLADNTPLARLIAQVVDEKFLAAVAKAHSEGRRLYIGTTNLDAGRLTVWNMGKIAQYGGPKALELFRKVMRASASIPVAFPPAYFHVEADGKNYDEMHVDGGACTQVFFYGFMLDLPAAMRDAGVPPELLAQAKIRIYVIRNGQIKAKWDDVQPRLLPIAGRAVADLLLNGGVGDLYRIYAIATRDGIEYRATSIPDDFVWKSNQMFDRGDMNRLFDLAFRMAKAGYPWSSLPPGMRERPTSAPATEPARP